MILFRIYTTVLPETDRPIRGRRFSSGNPGQIGGGRNRKISTPMPTIRLLGIMASNDGKDRRPVNPPNWEDETISSAWLGMNRD
jgi:hypothetical protein